MDAKTHAQFTTSHLQSLGKTAARQLAVTTKSHPMMEEITPRWLLSFLPWVATEAGTYRINKRKMYNIETARLEFSREGKKLHVLPEELRKIKLFENMSASFLEEVAGHLKQEKHPKGTVIIKEGSDPEKIFILAQGDVTISMTGQWGEKLILKYITHGEYFAELALIGKRTRRAAVTAIDDVTLLTLSKKDLNSLLEKFPTQKKHLTEISETFLDELNEYGERKVALKSSYEGEPEIPSSYVEYEESPHEISLSVIQTILAMHTRISDLYNDPMDQLQEQIRLSIEAMKERQEFELINNQQFGLINQVKPSMRVKTRYGTPTPDDMDELLARVWKKPAIFLAHPKAIAAFKDRNFNRLLKDRTFNRLSRFIAT